MDRQASRRDVGGRSGQMEPQGGLSFEIHRVSDVAVLPPAPIVRMVWSERGGAVACGGRHWRPLSAQRYLLVPMETEAALRGDAGQEGRFLALGADRALIETLESELRSFSRLGGGGAGPCASIGRMKGLCQTEQPEWMINSLRGLAASVASESPDLEFLGRHGRLVWERLVYSLALRRRGSFRRPSTPRKRMLSVRLHRARRLIETGFAEPINVSDLAAIACISRFHFVREFRRAFGQTPYQMLLDVRLGHARRMLASGDLTVQEVGRRTGFSSTDGFYRAFRRRYLGCPSAFQGHAGNAHPVE